MIPKKILIQIKVFRFEAKNLLTLPSACCVGLYPVDITINIYVGAMCYLLLSCNFWAGITFC